MRNLLKRNRKKINNELSSFDTRKYFSPSCYAESITTFQIKGSGSQFASANTALNQSNVLILLVLHLTLQIQINLLQ